MFFMSITSLTDFTRVQIAIDLKLHGQPVVMVEYQLQSAHVSLMPSGQRIVKVRHDLLSHVAILVTRTYHFPFVF
jgi:hypothetical protein